VINRLRFIVAQDDRGRPVVRARMAPPDHRRLATLRERQRSVELAFDRDAEPGSA
jgi:hypothetical protein